jgi:hypothetical protein
LHDSHANDYFGKFNETKQIKHTKRRANHISL